MASFKVKPSKPVAVFGAAGGMAVLVFVLASGIGRGNGFVWLWAAFGRRGATEVVERGAPDGAILAV
ncbi:hypothetical protein [Amycolatopsis keratiniphila]|uniref:Uncharacterized protein n=1 Tax=Amycolatopsis keratiniphila TaxID=129921 RepID=R4T8H2_9PSEU|nr:hypothetical protein [Amycolatopsis keratiniphila]AGM07237.1 hypothetical protein AORI_4653 [Amycolatopsis keratiniphila]